MCFFFNCHQVGSCRRVFDIGWGWWSHNHMWRHQIVVVKSGSVTRFGGRLWRARAWVVRLVRDWVETGEEVSVQVRRPASLHGGDALLSNEIINKVVWQSGAFFNFSIFVIPTFFKSFTNSPLSYLLCKRIAEELHSFISCQHFYCYFCCCVSKQFFLANHCHFFRVRVWVNVTPFPGVNVGLVRVCLKHTHRKERERQWQQCCFEEGRKRL